MSKQEFLNQLERRLAGLPTEDIDERLNFYSEMIDDRMEEGLSEEEAVNEIGPIDTVVSQILSETPFPIIVREKIRSKRSFETWEIVLLVLGFPLWFSLLVAAASLVFSVFVVIWSLAFSMWAVTFSFAISVIVAVLGGIVEIFHFEGWRGVAYISIGFIMTGFSILMFIASIYMSKAAILLSKKFWIKIKSFFVGGENA